MEDTSLADFVGGNGEQESTVAATGDGSPDDAPAEKRTAGESRHACCASNDSPEIPDTETGSGDGRADEDTARASPASGASGTDATTATTYAWSAMAEPCPRCGEAVEARWRGEVGLVCAACKDW